MKVKIDIGIIGSGQIGSILARHHTALGHQVSISNSRGPASFKAFAAETGTTAVTVERAAHAQDVVIIVVPEKVVSSTTRPSDGYIGYCSCLRQLQPDPRRSHCRD